MKTIIVSVGVWMAVSLLSCQKQLSLPGGPPVVDSLPADTIPVFEVTDIWQYNYDAAGNKIADSSHTIFLHDTIAFTLTKTYQYWDAVNGNNNSKHVYTYNESDNWMKEDEYDKSNYGLIKYTNVFTRNASGQVQRYDYSKDDYSGNARHFTAFFQHANLGGGIHETTVVDTNYLDFPRFTYYKVQQNASGNIVKRQLLPWSQSPYYVSDQYTYNADGQIQKVVDSTYVLSGSASYVTTILYTQEPKVTDALDVFTKQIKGKNFGWYMQDRFYNFNLLYDNYYVGKPLRSFTATELLIENGVVTNTKINAFTINNVIDLDSNLTEALISINGKMDRKYRFAYKKIKYRLK